MERTPTALLHYYYQTAKYFEYIMMFDYGITVIECTPGETLEDLHCKKPQKDFQNEFCKITATN